MFRNNYQKIQEEIQSAKDQYAENLIGIKVENDRTDTMQYVYHYKSPKFIGTWIIPLNKLPLLTNFESTYKQVYESALAKYNGREKTMEMTWPTLGNCKWNDVNFLSPVHPHHIYKEFQKIGISTDEAKLDYFYKIPITQLNLDPSKTIIWTFPAASDNSEVAFPKDSFCQLDPKTYKELDGLPEKTKTYYKEEFLNTGKRPLPFFYIPHIVTTEFIEITKEVSVVHWGNPR